MVAVPALIPPTSSAIPSIRRAPMSTGPAPANTILVTAATPTSATRPTETGAQITAAPPVVSNGPNPTYHMKTAAPSTTVAQSSDRRIHPLLLRAPTGTPSSAHTPNSTPPT